MIEPLPDDPVRLVRTALAVGLSEQARAALSDEPRTRPELEAWIAWVAGQGPDSDFLALRSGIDPGDLDRGLRYRLAEAAESAGDPAWADELRRGGVERDPAPGGGPGRMRLPTLGSSDAGGEPREERSRITTPAEWRRAVAEYSPISSSDPLAPLADLLDHVLGFRPDAPVGRIHLEPNLPANWTGVRVAGLACGATRFDLTYEREVGAGRRIDRWRLSPVRGAVPSTVILRVPAPESPIPESSIPGSSIPGSSIEVRIDGEPAELGIERIAGRRVFPVQLPLDGERVVEVIGADRPG